MAENEGTPNWGAMAAGHFPATPTPDKPAGEALMCRIGSCQRHGQCRYSPCRYRTPPPSALEDDVVAVLTRLEPHLDAIVCYASTMGEHEPNRIAHDIRALLTRIKDSSK